MLELMEGSMLCNVYCHLMFWIAYRYIHVFVYTGHILEMEDMCAILNWNDQKNGERGEL